MTTKANQTEWSRNVRATLRNLASAGIHEAPSTGLFEWCDHVTVSVEGLDGIGVIHQRAPGQPFNFCVFEPSDREKKGFTEILERTMNSLDELPQLVEEWRSFRSKTDNLESATGLVEHRKWLRAVANDKKKCLSQVRESGRLRETGNIKGAWQMAGFHVQIRRQLPADTPPIAKERLLEDFDAIAPDLLAWHLPRDDKGKWLLNRRAPLFRYDADKRRMSAFCLLVAMPQTRSSQPEIRAEWLQADLQTARLDAVPEKFDTRKVKDFAGELLGVDERKAHRFWSARGSSKAVAIQALQLQYEGQFDKAGKIVLVELDDLVLDCMRARRVAHMCTCCAPLDQQLLEWSNLLKKTLTALNLPRVVALALRDQERCHHRPRRDPIPIVPFPLQRHIRKAHIALDIRDGKRPRLTIDTTGSGNRLPIALWQRPVDIDLLREKLLDPGDLPKAVASQFGIGEQDGT